MFRMRAAGYKGPDNFTPEAEKMIGKASQGLLRRVNILADKALLAAFVENTHAIEVRHVQAALRDSEMMPMNPWANRKQVGIVGGMLLLAAILVGAGWFLNQERGVAAGQKEGADVRVPAVVPAVPVVATDTVAASATSAISEVAASEGAISPAASEATPIPVQHPPFPQVPGIPENGQLQQRLEATRLLWDSAPRGVVSIQLFYTERVRPNRMEGFLQRANRLGVLDQIYVLPIRLQGRDAFRVLYGVYPDGKAARAAIPQLPQRYRDAFAPTLYLLDDSQSAP